MSELGKKAFIKFRLQGKEVSAPIEWQDISVKANYPNDAIQPTISIDSFTFTLDEAGIIRQYILDGLTGGLGIFEGIPFEIISYNIDTSIIVFDGYLDLTDGFEDNINENKVICKLKKREDIVSIFERLESLTYGYLEDIGVFSDSDYSSIDYVVEKKINAFEIFVNSVLLFIILDKAIEETEKTLKSIGTFSGILAAGITGVVGAAIFAGLSAAARIAYTTILIIQVKKLADSLIDTFIPPKRKAKLSTYRILIEKTINYLGYTLQTNISDLDLYYLPSNPQLDDVGIKGFITRTKGVQKGIPNTQDFGYRCSEMFSLVQSLFNCKYAVQDGVVYLYNKYDPFWENQSTFNQPSIVTPNKKYNTKEVYSNRYYTFVTDNNDEWTIDNFSGTNYEVIINPIDVRDQNMVNLTGYSEQRFNVALGNRKDKLNALENIIKVALETIDGFVGTNLSQKVKNKIGLLKVEKNNYNNPKILRLSGGKLTPNHRDSLSAKYIENTYYIQESPIRGNYGQKLIYENVNIPFGLEDLIHLLNNSKFITFDDKTANAESIEWNIASDTADCNYVVYEKYTNNLKETFIEA